MALIQCGECARQISDQAATCPGCGAPVVMAAKSPVRADGEPQSAPKPKRRWGLILGCGFFALLAIVVILGIIGAHIPQDQNIAEANVRAQLANPGSAHFSEEYRAANHTQLCGQVTYNKGKVLGMEMIVTEPFIADITSGTHFALIGTDSDIWPVIQSMCEDNAAIHD